jgi:hypothetical protein
VEETVHHLDRHMRKGLDGIEGHDPAESGKGGVSTENERCGMPSDRQTHRYHRPSTHS